MALPVAALRRAASMAEATVWPAAPHQALRPAVLYRVVRELGPSFVAMTAARSRSKRSSQRPQLAWPSSFSGRCRSAGVIQLQLPGVLA